MFASKDTLLTRPSGYTIARSVRLRSSATAYFNRTNGTPTSSTTWTWSGWVKRGNIGSINQITGSGQSSGTNYAQLLFNGDAFGFNEIGATSNLSLVTTQVFRDPSAWYHIVLAVDTTQATASNRIKLYVNGSQVTAFSTANYPSQNYATYYNTSAYVKAIGNIWYNGAINTLYFFDGYLTEINFVDGQQLTPSSFGETDSITGVWKPKAYSGTYGTNGFELNFSDNSNNTAATIGKDYSGNGNNWTPNNISVTAGVTYDSMTDVPTLTSATAANYSVFNPLDIFVSGSGTTRTFADGNLNVTLTNPAGVYSAARGTLYIDTSVKSYFEVNFASGSSGGVGVCNQSSSWASGGFDANAWGYITNGSKSSNGNTSYGSSYSSGLSTIIGVAVNGGNIWFALNGTWQASGDPATGANPAFTNVTGPITVLVANSAGSTTNSYNLNCGQRPFSYTPPTGFVALNTYNLPASTITNGGLYMKPVLYTGDGTTNKSITGVGFQTDFNWTKSRSSASYSHQLSDSVRGFSKYLYSNATNAEGTDATNHIQSVNSDGYVINSGASFNASGVTYVAWNWKAGTTSASNTNGSITSTVSVGATQGFSVVTYTASSSASTIGHGLGVAPSMIIQKNRDAVSDWGVYHISVGATKFLKLNSTDVPATNSIPWNDTTPTSTVFSIGTGYTSGNKYVAYCFSAVAGYSAFGSYTGNGSTDGTFVYTGFRPRWLLIKRTNTTESWIVVDSSRDSYNVVANYMLIDTSNAEANGVSYDFVSNGIKFRGTSQNQSGATYIYACFAESPFKTSLAR